jgi:hypothetical protein
MRQCKPSHRSCSRRWPGPARRHAQTLAVVAVVAVGQQAAAMSRGLIVSRPFLWQLTMTYFFVACWKIRWFRSRFHPAGRPARLGEASEHARSLSCPLPHTLKLAGVTFIFMLVIIIFFPLASLLLVHQIKVFKFHLEFLKFAMDQLIISSVLSSSRLDRCDRNSRPRCVLAPVRVNNHGPWLLSSCECVLIYILLRWQRMGRFKLRKIYLRSNRETNLMDNVVMTISINMLVRPNRFVSRFSVHMCNGFYN